MSAEDLVVRLQATLDEWEEFARDAMQRRWLTTDNYIEDENGGEVARFELKRDAQHAGLNEPLSVLRLVQSHRDILAEWQKRRQMSDLLEANPATRNSDAMFFAQGIDAGLFAAITLVARGYGLEVQ